MAAFLRNLFEHGRITAAKVWSYCPTWITEEEAEEIAGPRPAG